MDKKQKSVKKLILTALFFILLLCVQSKVNATSINISPSNPKVGDTVTVTVSISDVNTADLTAYVSGSATGTVRVVGGDLSGQPSTFSKSENFYCGSEGTLSVSISSDSTAVLNGEYVNVGASASVNVTSNSSSSDDNSNNNNSDNGNSDNNNSDNNNNNNSNNNSDNNQNSGTPTTTTKSSNANLSNLGIRPNDFTGFRPGTTAYNVTVPNDVDQVTVYANLQDSKASLTGTGTKSLNVGRNALNVVVTAENGTQKTYTINVTREEQTEQEPEENTTPEETVEPDDSETSTSTSDLIKLEVTGYELTPEFSPDIYSYTLDLNGDVSSLDVVAEGANHNVSVEIVGNTDLVEGENIITVLVHNEETDTNSTYQIVVNKISADLEALNTALQDGTSQANRIRYIILGVVLFILVCIIIFLIVRKKYKNNNFENDIYEYDEEDRERIDNERLNLDEEEDFFNRVNKKDFERPEEEKVTVAPEVSSNLEDTQEEGSQPNIHIETEEEKEPETEEREEFFRASNPKRKGKHF